MIPLMKKEGYDADYAVNVTTHAALVGALMPTSHNLILFTLATSGIASVSVLGLILAGVVPALILTLCNLGAAYWVARKRGYRHPRRLSRAGARWGWPSLASLPGLLVVLHHPGRHPLGHAFTATESASIAVGLGAADHAAASTARCQLVTTFIKACAKACKTTGVVLLLIGISGRLRLLHGAVRSAAEDRRADEVGLQFEPWMIFLMINVLLFVLGTFLDMAPTILICTPIFMPIAHAVRHGPAAVRRRHADQLRARSEHAACGLGAVRGLRHRRGQRWGR